MFKKEFEISDEQIVAIVEQLKIDLDKAESGIAVTAVMDIKDVLCKGWPLVKNFLQMLLDEYKLSWAIRQAIKLVIFVGDILYERYCKD